MKEWKSGLDLGIKSGKEKHIKNILTLDTETTTIFKKKEEDVFYTEKEVDEMNLNIDDFETMGVLYIWMFGVDDCVYYGRTLEELKQFIEELEEQCKGLRATIFIHNLAYEFQFLRNIFKMKVFAREQRKVITCEIEGKNIEFRCSLCLSGLSLEKLAETFCTKTKKLTGSLDYKKLRHHKTKLTEEELKYCENDCLVLYEYISIMLSRYDNSFKKLPLTMTGIVRKKLKDYISKHYKGEKYKGVAFKWWKDFIANLSNNMKTFCDLVVSFSGGFVHTNFFERGVVHYNVHHRDYDSSYIASALSEKYPMSKFKNCDVNEPLDREKYCYIITAKYTEATCEKAFNFVQFSKVFRSAKGFKYDNGRLSYADEFTITATDCDIDVIDDFYSYKNKEIIEIKRARKEYLPKCLVEFIIELYLKKCELKKTKEENPIEYALAKQQLCSIYGMMITNSIRDEVNFDEYEWDVEKEQEEFIRTDEWEASERIKLQNEIHRQTKERENFLSYAWGVWISAYSRRNLMNIIKDVDFDGLYCDTDSLFYEGDYSETIKHSDEVMTEKIENMCKFHGIEMNDELRHLGHFDDEGDVKEFKALGAKRYAFKKYDDTIEITVSGVNKEEGAKALTSLDDFADGFTFSKEFSKKKGLIYHNNQKEITFADYQGNVETVSQKFGIAMIEATYTIEDSETYSSKDKTATAHKSVPISKFLLNL